MMMHMVIMTSVVAVRSFAANTKPRSNTVCGGKRAVYAPTTGTANSPNTEASSTTCRWRRHYQLLFGGDSEQLVCATRCCLEAMRGIVGSVATCVKLQGIEEDGPASSMPKRASVHFHTWPRVVPTMCIGCVAAFTRPRVCRLRSTGERSGGRSFGSPQTTRPPARARAR